MIKVESNMLVLDNSFSKEDVLAIDEFMKIVEKRTEERIIKLLEDLDRHGSTHSEFCAARHAYAAKAIALIKGEK